MRNSMKGMRVTRGISQYRFVLLLLTCGALSAQNQEHPVRNIVLVHGAWADSSGWKGVYDILVKDGQQYALMMSGMAAEIVLIDRDSRRAEGHVNDLRD